MASLMARELLDVLLAAHLRPPYLLVAHSYGGIIAREFLALIGAEAVAGVVFIDAMQERTLPDIRPEYGTLAIVLEGLDFLDLSGLRTSHCYTPDEFAAIAQDASVPTARPMTSLEHRSMAASSTALADKQQLSQRPLGLRPVTVIRGDYTKDATKLLEKAHEMRRGTPAQLQKLADFMDRCGRLDKPLQLEQLRLSANGRFVQARHSGHNVMATEPQLVADEIMNTFLAYQMLTAYR